MKVTMRRHNDHGVSEVIGALMLILIVVISGSALAVFISEKQKDIQNQDRVDTQRDLEKIRISHITPTKTTGTLWQDLEIDLSSLYLEGSAITRVLINGEIVYAATKYNSSSGSFDIPVSFNSPMDMGSLEVAILKVSLQDANFYGSKPDISETDYIRIDVHTELLNTFTKVFQPPSSIILVSTESQWDPSTTSYIGVTLIDGSSSFHPDDDAFIVSWNWSVIGDDDGDGIFGETAEEIFNLTGPKARIDSSFTAPAGSNHEITLIVTDNSGMKSTSTYVYNY